MWTAILVVIVVFVILCLLWDIGWEMISQVYKKVKKEASGVNNDKDI